MSVVSNILDAFQCVQFTVKDAYSVNPNTNRESVRARIYENLGTVFTRVSRGVYISVAEDAVLIEGDGRDLSFLEDSSIDCIITDHPWMDEKSNIGRNRSFASYDCFRYTVADFMEKSRVLKDGSFLCECVPAENANNYDYLYEIKKMAESAGFEYYCKVPWKKGTFVSNTGRNAKAFEDIIIFSKGKPRALKPDKQRGVINGIPTRFMSGTNGMLPAMFDVQAVSRKERITQSEKPARLFEQLLEFVTRPDEVVLDQFAGSGSVGQACLNAGRKCILVEKSHDLVVKISNRLCLSQIHAAGFVMA